MIKRDITDDRIMITNTIVTKKGTVLINPNPKFVKGYLKKTCLLISL